MLEEVQRIIDQYLNDDECYLSYRYEGEDEIEYGMESEVEKYLISKGVSYKIETVDGFDSCGYSCDTLAVAWVDDEGELQAINVLLESY